MRPIALNICSDEKDIPLGKLLTGLRFISEAAPKTEIQKVKANLCKTGVEKHHTTNGCSQFVPWESLSGQPHAIQLVQLFNSKDSGKTPTAVNNSIIVKFIIGKTYFIIGIDDELFSSINFFYDVFNLIFYRKAVVRLRQNLVGGVAGKLADLRSADHSLQLVPLAPALDRLADFVRALCVIVLVESTSSDETPRSEAGPDELAIWKVWNWSLNECLPNYGPLEGEEDLYSEGMYGTNRMLQEPDLADSYSTGAEDWQLGCESQTRFYTKDMILALRDSPLSRKKPENVDRINSIVKSYNGYHCSQHVEPVEEETREYTRKFLLSLRFAPLSLRRPVCVDRTTNTLFNHRSRSFRAKDGNYRQVDKDPTMTLWFSPMSSRRHGDDFDKLHCALHGYKHY